MLAPGSDTAAETAPGGGVVCEGNGLGVVCEGNVFGVAVTEGVGVGATACVGDAVFAGVGVGEGVVVAEAAGTARPVTSPIVRRESPTEWVRDVNFITLPA